jgi:maltooligosyltrehalose trehalohydrolase
MEFISPHRFVAYLQNHDQLGNRAGGERLCHLVNLDRVKIGAALLLTAPYVPLLFQGEEWSSSSPFQYFVDFHNEPALAQAVMSGRLKEFQDFDWSADQIADPTEPQSFKRSKLNWEEIDLSQHQEIMQWHRQLIELRRTYEDLTTGKADGTTVQYNEERQWLLISRGSIRIACNLGDQEAALTVSDPADAKILLASKSSIWRDNVLVLQAESVVILEVIITKDSGNPKSASD